MENVAQADDLPLINRYQMETTMEIPVHQTKAPFYLRCAALFIDYMLLLTLPVIVLIFSKFFNEVAGNTGISSTVWYLVIILWVIDFLALPLFSGQTFGKMLAGITMVKKDGSPARLGNLLRRNVLGYLLTTVTLGFGFLIAGLNKSGRSLHDYIGGTTVIQGKKRRA